MPIRSKAILATLVAFNGKIISVENFTLDAQFDVAAHGNAASIVVSSNVIESTAVVIDENVKALSSPAEVK